MQNNMKRYVKRPIPIHAFQWDGCLSTLRRNVSHDEEGRYFIPAMANPTVDNTCELHIRSLEGVEKVYPGDFVVKGVRGEFYPCNPDIFRQTYRLIDD